MTIQTRHIDYLDGDTLLCASMSWDDSLEGERPGVLVAHTWRGRGPFEDGKARALAELGYVGFALDMYGKGKLGTTAAQNAKYMQPFLDDRVMLQRRIGVAFETMRQQPEVDDSRAAAIGFCFGGLCALDLSRSGAGVDGVVSFHGLLQPPKEPAAATVSAKVLVLHGWDDPMATPDAVLEFAREMSKAGADWQLQAYGNTVHAFTNEAADDAANGLLYDPVAATRAWQSMQNLFKEIWN